jgi:hypothetical protein
LPVQLARSARLPSGAMAAKEACAPRVAYHAVLRF